MKKITNGMKFDIVFSNPPYNSGEDLKIFLNIKSIFKEAIIVHPSVWLFDKKNNEGYIKKFKKIYSSNFKKCIVFYGSDIFKIGFMSPLSITYLDNDKKIDDVEIDDKIINDFYKVSSIYDVTIYGTMAFKLNMFNKIDELSKRESILNHIHKDIKNLKFPIKLPLCRSGIPYFAGGHFDKKLKYFILNKSNYFFTCIAKGDPDKYHFNCNWENPNNQVLLFNFNSSLERENFYNYAKTKIFRWTLSWYKNNMNNSHGRPLRSTPWLDFTQHWDDKKLREEFEIDDDLWNYIDNFIPNCYEDYEYDKIL